MVRVKTRGNTTTTEINSIPNFFRNNNLNFKPNRNN